MAGNGLLTLGDPTALPPAGQPAPVSPNGGAITGQSNGGSNPYPNYETQALSPNNPLPWQTYMPTNVTDMAQQMQTNANTPGYFQGNLLHGVGSAVAGGGNSGPNASGAGGALGAGEGDAMGSAIARKYQNQAGAAIGNIAKQVNQNAPMMANAQTNQANQMTGTAQQIAMSNFQQQYAYQQQRATLFNQYQNQQTQANAAMWGSILQGSGTAAGAAAMLA